MSARARRVAIVTALALSNCHRDRYDLALRFADGVERARARSYDVFVVARCPAAGASAPDDDTVQRSQSFMGDSGAMAVGEVAAGTVRVFARARGEDCAVYAAGCTEAAVRAGGSGTLTVTLAAVTGMGCEPGAACIAGVCTANDTDAATAGRVLYVATTGNDGAAGTFAAPWRTLAASLPRLGAGDTLFVRGGTYRERLTALVLRPGSALARVRVVAHAGERPVLQGLLWINGARFWSFQGLNVTWDDERATGQERMVQFTDGLAWEFAGAELSGARSFAALRVSSRTVGEPTDWSVHHNCIHDIAATNATNADSLVSIDTGANGRGGLVERNLLFNAANGHGVRLSGATGVTVRRNTVFNTVNNLYVSNAAADNLLEGNLLGGVRAAASSASIRGFDLTGTGNVARGNAGFAASALLETSSGSATIADGGRNVFPLDPNFDATSSCADFHPRSTAAMAYGRDAP